MASLKVFKEKLSDWNLEFRERFMKSRLKCGCVGDLTEKSLKFKGNFKSFGDLLVIT